MRYEEPKIDIIYLNEKFMITTVIGASGGDNTENQDGSDWL